MSPSLGRWQSLKLYLIEREILATISAASFMQVVSNLFANLAGGVMGRAILRMRKLPGGEHSSLPVLYLPDLDMADFDVPLTTTPTTSPRSGKDLH